MLGSIARYGQTLVRDFGAAWNEFWFRPSDPYVLCVMRIATGLVALYMYAIFGLDLVEFFGAGGLVPVDVVEVHDAGWYGLSYFRLMTTPGELLVTHYAGLVVLALFTVGLFTRVTSVLSLIVVLDYVHRARVLTSQPEVLLCMLLVYLCLAPCGRYLSIDAYRARRRQAQDVARGRQVDRGRFSLGAAIATRLIQVHLAAIVLSSTLSMLTAAVWWQGDAIWWIVARPEARIIDLAALLHGHPFLVNALTHGVVLVGLTFPVLIWVRLLRPLVLAVAMATWIFLALATGLVTFGVLMLTASLAFVDPEAFPRIFSPRAEATTAAPAV